MIKRLKNFRRRFFLTPKEVKEHEDAIFKMKAEFDKRLAVVHAVSAEDFSVGTIRCYLDFEKEIFRELRGDRDYLIDDITRRIRKHIELVLDRPARKG